MGKFGYMGPVRIHIKIHQQYRVTRLLAPCTYKQAKKRVKRRGKYSWVWHVLD